jgi:hypothetical protein
VVFFGFAEDGGAVEDGAADVVDVGGEAVVGDGSGAACPPSDGEQPATTRRQVIATSRLRTALTMPQRRHDYAGTRHR